MPSAALRTLLSDDDIQSIRDYAKQIYGSAEPDVGMVDYGNGHHATYLHHGGFMHDDCWRTFQQACAPLLARMIEQVKRAADESKLCACHEFDVLNIRCIEYHLYGPGAGLEDKGHTDLGSTLTLSALLSDPGQCTGGVFSTTERLDCSVDRAHEGTSSENVIEHEMHRGDAVVFRSETVHNVSMVQSGHRESLVIEWWPQKPNKRDRFS